MMVTICLLGDALVLLMLSDIDDVGRLDVHENYAQLMRAV